MKLDSKQQEQILRFLDERWPQPRNCTVCNNNQWTIHPLLMEMRSFAKGIVTVEKQNREPNKALHWTGIPLRSILASEL